MRYRVTVVLPHPVPSTVVLVSPWVIVMLPAVVEQPAFWFDSTAVRPPTTANPRTPTIIALMACAACWRA